MKAAAAAAGSVMLISLLGNAALGWAWVDARDGRAKAIADRDLAQQLTRECSAATDRLKDLAEERATTAKKAQDTARTVALAHNKFAAKLLSTPPAIPGDDCGSARVRVDSWLNERMAP